MSNWGTVIKVVAVLGGAGLIVVILLRILLRKFSARVDKREAAIRAILPGANCGACGFPRCNGYASAVAAGEAPLNTCVVRIPDVAHRIGDIMGQEVTPTEPRVAFLICRGGKKRAASRSRQERKKYCRQPAPPPDVPDDCRYGCVGLGLCAKVCPFSAITMGENGLPAIDEKKCTGCGKCVRECPKQTLVLVPRSKLVVLACASHDEGKAVKDVCRVGCIVCDLCVTACPAQALAMDKNLPVMDVSKCIDCGICVQKCPTRSFIDRAPGRPKALINPRCTGCQACVKVCQFQAIRPKGTRGRGRAPEPEPRPQTPEPLCIVADKCIGCGECRKVCPADAIDTVGALGHAAKCA